jgi:hypothetical protein
MIEPPQPCGRKRERKMSEVESVSVPAEALSTILNYNWGDEYGDFLGNPCEDHIFMSLLEVSAAFKGWNSDAILDGIREDLEELEDLDADEKKAVVKALAMIGV